MVILLLEHYFSIAMQLKLNNQRHYKKTNQTTHVCKFQITTQKPHQKQKRQKQRKNKVTEKKQKNHEKKQRKQPYSL